MIVIIFYISYLILMYSYREYETNTNIEYIKKLTKNVELKIDDAKKIIEYKTSKAYRNKILKEQQSFKNIWEEVIYFTTEKDYNKYTTVKEDLKEENINIIIDETEEKIKDLNIYERWKYFLFKSHPYEK